ncbi:MAG TPA: hypothetical protein VMB71_16160 [Acetobacteraceae bacterium]|nr:hypothetical protein [Acetobacteraceae bacterium]
MKSFMFAVPAALGLAMATGAALAQTPTPAAKPAPAATHAATPAPAPAKTAPAPAAAAAATGTPVFPSEISPAHAKETAGKARMHTCLDQYHANKATNSNGGLHWIQKGGGYYSECLKQLKK